jgi:hypothetical protein
VGRRVCLEEAESAPHGQNFNQMEYNYNVNRFEALEVNLGNELHGM